MCERATEKDECLLNPPHYLQNDLMKFALMLTFPISFHTLYYIIPYIYIYKSGLLRIIVKVRFFNKGNEKPSHSLIHLNSYTCWKGLLVTL